MTAGRVLLTGVLGFSGQYLARKLHADGFEVHGIARCSDAEGSADLPVVLRRADIRRADEIRAILLESRPNYVVHLAGISHAAHGNLEELYLNNVVGTRVLLGELASATRDVEHVILASSANVYGNQEVSILHEGLPQNPVNDYGVSKVAVEHLGAMFSDRLPITTVRPFNYTGVGQSTSFLIPKIVEHFRKKEPFIQLGNLDVARDFSDVRDICAMYGNLLGRASAYGQVVNLCSGNANPLRTILAICRQMTGLDLQVRVNPDLVRANEVRSLSGSTALLDELVGPLTRIPLERTLNWMLGAQA